MFKITRLKPNYTCCCFFQQTASQGFFRMVYYEWNYEKVILITRSIYLFHYLFPWIYIHFMSISNYIFFICSQFSGSLNFWSMCLTILLRKLPFTTYYNFTKHKVLCILISQNRAKSIIFFFLVYIQDLNQNLLLPKK